MWQHMVSFAARLLQNGYPARLLISPGFRWMNKDYDALTHYTDHLNFLPPRTKNLLSLFWFPWGHYRRLLQSHPPAAVLLVSWHPANFLMARLVKSLFPDVPVLAWLHEPYKDDKRLYGSKAMIINFVEWTQALSLNYVDILILHSQRGLRQFNRKYPDFQGVKQVIPLFFQDDGFDDTAPRRWVSFLGRAQRAKGIELFFNLVEDLTEVDFQIVTASDIQGYLKNLSAPARCRLKVVNRPQISDKDLRLAAQSSLAVLALYKETTQSGVIPVALMKGTPVIGTEVEGLSEWIRNKETGVLVSLQPSTAEIMEAISYIRDHFAEMTHRCRMAYLSTFDDGNWQERYGWLSQLLSPPVLQ
jgi:glycosyltransferase involved in cell wall biosynthesis